MKRVYEAAREAGKIPGDNPQAELARLLNASPQTINNWAARGVSRNGLLAIQKAVGCDAHWLSTGEGPKFLTAAQGEAIVAAPRAEPGPSSDIVEVRVLDQAASMGYGAQRQDFVDTIDVVRINKLWLRQNLTFTSFDNLALITGLGDSMEGTFSDGDVLLVDRGVNDLKLDAVYVLGLGDEVYIKRIQRRPDGTFLMISDNPKYPPYLINETDNFQVLARVLLAWNARRL